MRRNAAYSNWPRLWFTVLALACSAVAPVGASDDILELQTKAAFLYNLSKFVEWPGAGPNGDGSFAFCLVGADPLFPVLGQSLRGKMMNGRTLTARRVEKSIAAQHCNVVFIGGGEKKHLAEVLDAARESGVLTVGDFDQFANQGGMIQLIKDPNTFRFTINVEAVNKTGLRISSRLLQLAGKTSVAGVAGGKP